ncbi:Smr/MutS family protein [Polaribacter sp. Z014]|uniref:Smr/MutS family protein n=1 Tax=unclassified Polaribacter TaxID=196858 RepID=UPI00193B52D0|nr:MULTISPECIES: Smr/MutS family protein [unclassified Polaribacter]MCL7763147.1 Smr/MutS family protein [Polaribacter sp. Z014]QVY64994.1 Smr/MutS family protein [Polaribacter sp. Q13]QVY65432.1 Smr/MutS family protein [Polaribacter sp. Q13]
MNLEIGNKVAVLDDVLKGKVININGDEIFVETTDGMVFKFHSSELVRIDVEQHELSKYSDINNALLKDKIAQNPPKKSLFKKEKKEVILEVDLHINKLAKSTKYMDNYDMLNLQLDTAKNKVEFAISKRISKVVFIHGVGEGVLRSELQRLLSKYPVKFYDASYKKYGLGATEVYIFQNPN